MGVPIATVPAVRHDGSSLNAAAKLPVATVPAVRQDGSSLNAAAKEHITEPVREGLQEQQPDSTVNPEYGSVVLPGEPQPPTPPLGKED